MDASERLPMKDSSSFNINKSYADIIIDNNGTLEEFERRVLNFGNFFLKKKYDLVS